MHENVLIQDYKISLVKTKTTYNVRIHSKELNNTVIKTVSARTNSKKQARSFGEQLLYAGPSDQDQKQLTNKVAIHAAKSLAWNER